MSNQFLKLRRSSVPGRVPTTASLDFGEIALNTHDGLAFIKKSSSNGEEVIAIGATATVSGSQYFIPVFSGSGVTESTIFQSGSFIAFPNATEPTDPNNPDLLYISGAGVDTYNLISAHSYKNGYIQLNIQNFSPGNLASSDIVATANNGDESNYYIDMGINSEGYSNANLIGSANDAYVYSTGNDLYIGNASANKRLILFNGGFDTLNYAKVFVHDQGTVGINSSTYNAANPPSLFVNSRDSVTTNVIQAKADADDFTEVSHANLNAGTAASADFVAYNDIDPEGQSSGYVDMGINSTNYVYNGIYPGTAGDAYVYTDSHHLILGTISQSVESKVTIFAGGVSETDNAKLVLYGSNQHVMTGSLNASQGFTGSLFGTASWALNSRTASYVGNAVSASYAATASYAPLYLPLTGGVINGNVTVNGTASIAFLNVTYESSSIIVSTGSNVFGDAANDTQTLYGSVIIPTGSLTVTGSVTISGSLFATSSWAINALTASYVPSTAIIGDLSRIATGSVTASVGVGTSSFQLTSGSSTFLFVSNSGNVGIGKSTPSASLDVSGSFIVNIPASSYDFVVTGSASGSIVRVGTDQQVLQGALYIPKLYVKPNFTQNRAGIHVANNIAGTVYPALYSGYGNENEGLLNAMRFQYLQTSSANDQNGYYFTIATDSRYGFFAFNNLTTTGNTNSGSNGFASNLYFQNQGGASLTGSGAYVGYKSLVQFATPPILVNAASDFLADTLRGQGNGTLTNRYGLHITFTSESVTNPWGVYQVSNTVNNHFNGGVYIGTTTTSSLKLDVSGSGRFTSGLTVTGSLIAPNITGSLFGTASWAQNVATASYVTASNVYGPFGSNSVISSSYALTASYVLGGASTINIQDEGSAQGSAGTINFVGTGVTATVGGGIATVNIPGAGGTTFPYTGSAVISGSLIVTGSVSATQGGFTGSLLGTASWAQNAVTASYVTGSVFTSTNPALSASYALTASYALNSLPPFPYTGSAQITGSLGVTGSVSFLSSSLTISSSTGTGLTVTPVSPTGVVAVNIDSNATGGTISSLNFRQNQYSAKIDGSNLNSIRVFNDTPSTVSQILWSRNNATSSNISFAVNTSLESILYLNGSNGFIGVRNTNPSYQLDVSGSGNYTNGLTVTGSLIAPNITGSLFGTSSWAQNVLTASYVTGSIHNSANPALSASYALSSSFAVSALTASYVLGGSSTINIQDEGSPQGSAGTINFVGPGVTATVSAGTATVTINPTGSTALHTQASPAVTWSFNHNLGNLYPVLNVWDSNGFMIMPGGVKTVNTNQLEIYFDIAQAGYASAVVGGTAVSASYALTASYALNGGSGPASVMDNIASGVVTASVANSAGGIFLIKSGSVSMFEVSGSGRFTANSSLFIIKNYTTQQPVFTVSESVVKFATQSSAPTGNADNGAFWFTGTDLYIGLN